MWPVSRSNASALQLSTKLRKTFSRVNGDSVFRSPTVSSWRHNSHGSELPPRSLNPPYLFFTPPTSLRIPSNSWRGILLIPMSQSRGLIFPKPHSCLRNASRTPPANTLIFAPRESRCHNSSLPALCQSSVCMASRTVEIVSLRILFQTLRGCLYRWNPISHESDVQVYVSLSCRACGIELQKD